MTGAAVGSLALSAITAVAAGLIGSFALMRRMTLAADALSHVALPGIGVAILLRIHPLAGAVVALVAGAVLIWGLESRTQLATETIIGVVFSTALAVGALLTTGEELMDALFGTPGTLSGTELVTGFVGASVIIAFALLARDRLVVMFVSSDIARTTGIRVRRLSLLYLLAFALTVALGLRYLGALLMGSLMIIPPATARRLAHNLPSMLTISVGVALIATLAGGWLAERMHRPGGPLIVSVAAGCFLEPHCAAHTFGVIANSDARGPSPRRCLGESPIEFEHGIRILSWMQTKDSVRNAVLLVVACVIAGCASDKSVYTTQTQANPPAAALSFVGYQNTSLKQTVCGNCHVDQQGTWVATAHARAWSDMQATGIGGPACYSCHTVNSNGNGGTNDSAGYLGTNDSRYQDVQCESCHGAGLGHVNAPALSNILLASVQVDTGLNANKYGCGQCHTTGYHEPYVAQWSESNHGHSVEAPALADYLNGSNTTCVGCHTAQGALATWGVQTNYREIDSLTTDAVPITCAVCHNPHGSANPAQLRFPLNVADTSKQLCMRCHQRLSTAVASNTRGPHSPEGPTLIGTAGWWPPSYTGPDTIIATHGNVAVNPNLCATCHASQFPIHNATTGSTTFNATGHLFFAIPCLGPDSLPLPTQTCATASRSFNACTASGCHGSPAAAEAAFVAADAAVATLDSTLAGMLRLVPASALSAATITTARGAQFNLQLAEEPGGPTHNIFLIETLMSASIQQVSTDYSIPDFMISPAARAIMTRALANARSRVRTQPR